MFAVKLKIRLRSAFSYDRSSSECVSVKTLADRQCNDWSLRVLVTLLATSKKDNLNYTASCYCDLLEPLSGSNYKRLYSMRLLSQWWFLLEYLLVTGCKTFTGLSECRRLYFILTFCE
jgi:hypothetical protein